MSARCYLPVLFLLALTGCGDRGAGPATAAEQALLDLDRKTIEAYGEMAAQVMPDEAERRWEEIDWQATYADGLKAASDAGKPVMLWVMNGHPLGCT